MTVARIAVTIAVAVALQTTLLPYLVGNWSGIDLVLVAVIYVAMMTGPVTALVSGALGGIVQDALSGGLIGVGGVAKTLVGFSVAMLSAQVIVVPALPRFVVFFLSTLVHGVVFLGLYSMLESYNPNTGIGAVFGQSLGNGVAGVVLFELTKVLPRLGALRLRGFNSGRVKPRMEW
ncbi:MAG: rod shape-determining protein MreD [Acidobacteriota bacterium]|nr:rod shape-determining protein MreD [Acidobacteriota bacterium]